MVEIDVQHGEKLKTHERVRRAPGTRLIIPTAHDTLLMTREFRSELGKEDYRLPGGKVFDTLDAYHQARQQGDDILAHALRGAQQEGREEVGIDIEKAEHVGTSTCGATVDWDLYYFVVNKYSQLPQGQTLEDGESISVVELPIDEILRMCLDGRIQEDRSAAMLLRYYKDRLSSL